MSEQEGEGTQQVCVCVVCARVCKTAVFGSKDEWSNLWWAPGGHTD